MSADDLQQRLLAVVAASGSLLRSPRVDDVIPAVLRIARDLVAADGYAIWRLDTHDVWRIRSFDGVSRDLREPRRQQLERVGRFVRALQRSLRRRGRLLVRSGAAIEPPPTPTRGSDRFCPCRSAARAPATAALVLYYRTPHRFTDVEVETARALGNMAAAALTTAELYDEQRRTREQAALLAQASAALADSLEFETTLQYGRAPRRARHRRLVRHPSHRRGRPHPARRGRACRSAEDAGDADARRSDDRRARPAAGSARFATARRRCSPISTRPPSTRSLRGRSGCSCARSTRCGSPARSRCRCSRAAGPSAASPSRSGPASAATTRPTFGSPRISRSARPSPSTTRASTARRRKAKPAAAIGQSRARFLADVGETLASSLDYETTLKTVANLAVPDIADWCTVDILDEHGGAAAAGRGPRRSGEAPSRRDASRRGIPSRATRRAACGRSSGRASRR